MRRLHGELVRRAFCTLSLPLEGTPLPIPARTRRKLLKQSMDLRDPEQAYPLARSMRRTVHAHLGPTNSGKTHSALQALRTARSGVYCGPLRLLAWEVHDRLSNAGLLCNLRTGQEIREPEGGAWHTSCTIEMAGINRPIDVAVVDEIQMLTHPERGWAWSRALLGLPSDIVHVCGSADALPLLEQLVEACEDELIVHTYERLSPLSVSRHSLDGDLSRIQPGDCLVAFSRREIFSLKQRVEEASGLECCMVYGSLPPETRSAQAKDFNDPGTSSQVLVASDAIGMGLNLNIQRIVFSSLHKFDGMQVRRARRRTHSERAIAYHRSASLSPSPTSSGPPVSASPDPVVRSQVRPLQPTEVMQIAGRAGRYGTAYAAGEVTCLHQSDLPMLRRAMDTTLQPLKKSGLAPTFEQLDLFDRASGQRLYFSQLLTAFEDSARLSSRHFCCDLESTIRLAEVRRILHCPVLASCPLAPTIGRGRTP